MQSSKLIPAIIGGLLLGTCLPALAQKSSLDEIVAADEPRLIDIFKNLHANPELSMQETKTAALVAKELKALGFEVQTGIGKTGVVGVMKNGPGPVIMFRADMDALPVKEETGLPYASSKTGKTLDGIDQLNVTIKGIGGHGSTPHASKDPIVMSAQAIMAYQTIVSRRIDQTEPVVLTVGAIQAGTVNNIIPDEALLKLSLRWYSRQAREQMITMVKQVTDAIAVGNGMPADRMPAYAITQTVSPVINDEGLVAVARPALVAALGENNVYPGLPMQMGSEDFQMLGDPVKGVKILHMEVGVAKPEVLAACRPS